LSLVNPAICAAIFSKLETGRGRGAKTADAVKAAVVIFVILGLAAVFGAKVLQTFGVSLDAFSVAGGFVLAWMGFGMIKGGSANDKSHDDNHASTDSVSLSPLILFAASPGTITGVITLSVAHSRTDIPVTALVAIGITVVVTLGIMLLVSFFGGKNQGDGLVRQTITHLMGLIVLAMGFQFALTGIKAFMA
jgi:multiple antibiotic resistance protein